MWSECENTVEADLVSAEEDRGGHTEQKNKKKKNKEVEVCGVTVGRNLQIRLSTFSFFVWSESV